MAAAEEVGAALPPRDDRLERPRRRVRGRVGRARPGAPRHTLLRRGGHRRPRLPPTEGVQRALPRQQVALPSTAPYAAPF